MSQFAVWIVAPPGDIHWQCLREVASGIAVALRQLGHATVLVHGDGEVLGRAALAGHRFIVFGAHRLPDIGNPKLPENAIIYNAEQVPPTVVLTPKAQAYLDLLAKHCVWDYSTANIERLKSRSIERATICPVGYYAGLSNIRPAETSVDVLHVGSVNERRRAVLADLAGRKLTVRALFGVYGDQRDYWIARSKIVLNVHFYSEPIFEIFRASHALANKKCVVTEDGGRDPVLEDFASRACSRVPYGKIAEECEALVLDDARRTEIAECGFEELVKIDQMEAVRSALAGL